MMEKLKPYRSFTQWVLLTQWPFVVLFHSIVAYGVFLLIDEPIEELGWAIFTWLLLAGIVVLFWKGNHWYYRKRLVPFMEKRKA